MVQNRLIACAAVGLAMFAAMVLAQSPAATWQLASGNGAQVDKVTCGDARAYESVANNGAVAFEKVVVSSCMDPNDAMLDQFDLSAVAQGTTNDKDKTIGMVFLPGETGAARYRLIAHTAGDQNKAVNCNGGCISEDGGHAVCDTDQADLVSGGDSVQAGNRRIVVWTPADGGQIDNPNMNGWNARLSNDGRFYCFESDQRSSEGLPTTNIWLRDIVGGTTTLITKLSLVGSPPQGSIVGSQVSDCDVNADGSVVVFAATGNAFATLGDFSKVVNVSSGWQVYKWSKSPSETMTLVSRNPAGEASPLESTDPKTDALGRFVVFEADSIPFFFPGVTTGTSIPNFQSQGVVLVDTTKLDAQASFFHPNRGSVDPKQQLFGGFDPDISADGRFVVYEGCCGDNTNPIMASDADTFDFSAVGGPNRPDEDLNYIYDRVTNLAYRISGTFAPGEIHGIEDPRISPNAAWYTTAGGDAYAFRLAGAVSDPFGINGSNTRAQWVSDSFPRCGNAVLDDGEQCDSGADNGVTGSCSSACTTVNGACEIACSAPPKPSKGPKPTKVPKPSLNPSKVPEPLVHVMEVEFNCDPNQSGGVCDLNCFDVARLTGQTEWFLCSAGSDPDRQPQVHKDNTFSVVLYALSGDSAGHLTDAEAQAGETALLASAECTDPNKCSTELRHGVSYAKFFNNGAAICSASMLLVAVGVALVGLAI